MNFNISGKKLLYIPGSLLALSLIYLVYSYFAPSKVTFTGEIEATQIDIASKIPGRIDSLLIKEGDRVKKGQVLAVIKSPEIEAKYEQAQGAVEAAKAMLDMAVKGARSEEIDAAYRLYEAAEAQYRFAEKSFTRLKTLYDENIIAKQMFDEAEFKYKAARAQKEAAARKWEMAKKGAREEKIRAAEGNYRRALNTLKEVESYLKETEITAPRDGEIDNIIVEAGELTATGYPIISMVDLSESRLSVFVPEDKLSLLPVGRQVPVVIPALSSTESFLFKVTHVAVLGDFATRRASNEKGDFDLKSFEVVLHPVTPLEGLRPGMSGRITINR